jgi:hypothetical protein
LTTFASVFNTAILKQLFLFFSAFFLSLCSFSQRPREVQDQNHFWWSVNTKAKIAGRWSLEADLHIRRTDFLKNNSFIYTRLGVGYSFNEQLSVSAGGGRMWLANRNGATELFSNEHRLVEQVQLNNKIGKITLTQRLRVEQRWIQKVVNFQLADDYRYVNRFRFLLSLNVPISNNKKIPSFVLADELMMQTGKDIIYNNFDQNRFFAGFKQQLTKTLSFDFGYMHVWQQKLSGYQYSRNHTIRWFFYWQPDWRRKNKSVAPAIPLPVD